MIFLHIDRVYGDVLVLRYGRCFLGNGWEGGAGHGRIARDRRGDGAAVFGGWRTGSFQLQAGKGTGADADGRVRRPEPVRTDRAGLEFAGGRAGPWWARRIKAFGRLDALVVNHGVWPSEDAPIELMTEEQWRSTMAINLDSVFGLVQAAVVQMQLQGPPPTDEDGPKGHIVLISSTAGQRGEALHADYAVTKGALISLTKSLSSELAPRGILVNCVAPGWVATDMSAGTLANPTLGARIRAGIPVGAWLRRWRLRGRCCFCVRRWRDSFRVKC